MGTPFSEIYDTFLSQMKDYEILEMMNTPEGIELFEKNAFLWLRNAIPHFHSCKKDLNNYNKELEMFDEILNVSEQYILAKYMIHSYISTYLIREENLSQALNSKDYRMYSPANQLKALQGLSEHIKNEGSTLQSQYSWNSRSLKELFTNGF